MKTKTLVKSAGATLAISAFGLTVGGLAAPASAYPIPTTTTLGAIIPPTPPTNVTLPETGSSGVGDSTMLGASIAILGGGLVLVSRRRRDPAPTD